MNKKTLGIVILLMGVSCGIYGFILVTGHSGTYKPWRSPFSHYEIRTFVVIVVAVIGAWLGLSLLSNSE